MRQRPSLVFIAAFLLAIGASGCASDQGKRKLSPREQVALLVDSATAAIGDKDSVGALQSLADAERVDPDFAPIYNARAAVHYIRKDLPAALEQAQRSVRVDPEYSAGLTTLGKILLDMGRLKEALPPLEKAAKDPLYREAYKALTHIGVINYRQQRFEDALKNFDRAVDLAPTQACVAFYYRGHLRLREAKYKEAIRDYAAATRRMCGSFSDAHLALAMAYERSGQYGLARKKYLEIQQIFGNTEVADRAIERLKDIP